MTINGKKQLHTFIKLMKVFKLTDPNASLALLEAFIRIAEKGDNGISVSELIRITGASSGNLARLIAVLSEFGRGTKKGLCLIKIVEDPADRRYKNVFLTRKGKELSEALNDVLESNNNNNGVAA